MPRLFMLIRAVPQRYVTWGKVYRDLDGHSLLLLRPNPSPLSPAFTPIIHRPPTSPLVISTLPSIYLSTHLYVHGCILLIPLPTPRSFIFLLPLSLSYPLFFSQLPPLPPSPPATSRNTKQPMALTSLVDEEVMVSVHDPVH